MDRRLHTRRFPRTMNEAFGPYAGTRYVTARKDSNNHPLWWVLAVALIAVLVLLCFSQA